MKVTLLYFAGVRDLVGREREDVALPSGVRSIGALAQWLERERPALAGRLAQVRFARNEEFAAASDSIGEGDEIAIIPPVSGG